MLREQSKSLLPKTESKRKSHSFPFYIILFFTCVGVLSCLYETSPFHQDKELDVGVKQGVGVSIPGVSPENSETEGSPSAAASSETVQQPAAGSSSGIVQSPAVAPPVELEPQTKKEVVDLPALRPDVMQDQPQSSDQQLSRFAKCSDPEHGFEAKVAPCRNYMKPYNLHAVKMTYWSNLQIPLVLDNTRFCKGPVCDHHDHKCCQARRPCTEFLTDVPDACPQDTRPNPFEFAFCQSIPCTVFDANTCCIKVKIGPRTPNPYPPGPTPPQNYIWYEGLYERYEGTSKRSRIQPDDKSPYTDPPITFSKGQIVWFDMSKKREVGVDSWAPLVNFMASWGVSMGWKTEAWMKVTEPKYKQAHSTMEGKMLSWPELDRSVELQQLYP